jgi:aminoglycoside phosphotransferase family enzyme/predicted kinase
MTDGHFDSDLLAFLRVPASYPHHPQEVREVHTHASLVLIVPPYVYKIKKPVDLGFLDFTTLEKRRYFCEREVALNSRLAPGIYLGVETITRQGGGFSFGGNGPVVEFAVRMLLLSADGFLDARVKDGTAGAAEIERVARTLATFYQKQRPVPEIEEWGSIEKIRVNTDENFSQTEAFFGKTISRTAFEAIREFTDCCYERRRSLFEKRVSVGWIRDCHGDLHLDHVHVTDDTLNIYDCIEFNDRFRYVDVASDVAFLAMDLDYHGRSDLGQFLVERVSKLLGDGEMAGLMDFYKCYRAFVRGKVEGLHSMVEIAGTEERNMAITKARRYYQLALQYAVCGADAVALVFMGRVASGKSSLAEEVSRELGWRLVSSDKLRKTLAGVPLHERGDVESRQALYAAEMSERTYEVMICEAREALGRGQGVILDATFSKQVFRNLLRETLGDAHVKWIIAEVDDETARERLRMRDGLRNVVSDARGEDFELLGDAYEPPDELRGENTCHVLTNGATEATLRRLLIALAQRQARRFSA